MAIRYSFPELVEPFRDDFLGTYDLAAPEEARPDPNDDPPIFFRRIRRFITDHAMKGVVGMLLGLNFFDLEPMKNLHERMNGIFQIVAPLGKVFAFSLLVRGGAQLFGQAIKMIEEKHEVVNERFLERFVQKIVPIFEELVMQRVKEPLIHAFAVSNRSQLFVNFFEACREIDLLGRRHRRSELIEALGKRVLNSLDAVV